MRILWNTKEQQNQEELKNVRENTHTDRPALTGQMSVSGSSAVSMQLGMGNQLADIFAEAGGNAASQVAGSSMQEGRLESMYLTVLSNTTSEEDYQKMTADGYDPSELDAETGVTILDTIRLAVAKGGTEIAGYTDTVSEDAMTEILGSAAYAQAVKQAQSLTPLDDGETRYLIANEMEPTISNLYKAQFSAADGSALSRTSFYEDGTKGYFARKPEQVDMSQLAGQVDQIIANAGMEHTEGTDQAAAYLVNQGLVLTEDTLQRYTVLQGLQLPVSDTQLAGSLQAAASLGRSPLDADLSVTQNAYTQALDLEETTLQLSPEAADLTVQEGRTLNLRNLQFSRRKIEAAQAERTAQAAVLTGNNTQTDNTVQTGQLTGTENTAQMTKARSQLVQVQLVMTAQANLKLLRSGFQIDTQPLDRLAEQLAAAQQGSSGEVAQAQEIAGQAAAMADLPAAVLGLTVRREISFRMQEITSAGETLRTQYEKAGQLYEALGTAPRTDLGDSIQTAFRSTDTLLTQLQLSPTAENQRAVRILGYNRMEVTQENVSRVISADQTVQQVIREMTPAATLQMIRDGINPLETDLTQLSDYLKNSSVSFSAESQKYSTFLVQMEQKNAVTQQEQEAYIGVYRLLRQLEKTDGAAIGYLVQTGAEVNMGNLLSAIRSGKQKTMDYRVSDAFGGVTAAQQTASISDQINLIQQTGYARAAWDGISPQTLSQVSVSEDTTLEELADALTNGSRQQTAGNDLQSLQLLQRDAGDQTQVAFLLEHQLPVTPAYLQAAGSLAQGGGNTFRSVRRLSEETGTIDYAQMCEELREGFTDTQEAQTAYRKFAGQVTEILQAREEQTTSSLDLKALQSIHKQMTLMTGMVQQEDYEVPVQIHGTETSIHLKIVHSEAESLVSVHMALTETGALDGEFAAQEDGSLNAFLTAQQQEGETYLKELVPGLQAALQAAGFTTGEIPVVRGGSRPQSASSATPKNNSRKLQQAGAQATETAETKISTGKLYLVAKTFLETIRKE